jgi:hypothetical protein
MNRNEYDKLEKLATYFFGVITGIGLGILIGMILK